MRQQTKGPVLIMTTPIFIFGDGGPLLFEKIEKAATYLEAIDVENGEYSSVFDAEGNRLELRVKKRSERILGIFPSIKEQVEIFSPAVPSKCPEDLKAMLIRSLGSNEEASSKTLKEIVQEAVNRFGFTG